MLGPQRMYPLRKDVILVGGGHAHVEVLRRFGMNPLPGIRLTLVTPEVLTPYSGMIPGYVSGFYSKDDCHIDLVKLARFANARLVLGEAEGINVKSRTIRLLNRPDLAYDVLSLNVGITPSAEEVEGAKDYCIPVKPINTFAARFEQLLNKATSEDKPMKMIVVGGGAGGVEIACALKYRIMEERSKLEMKNPVSVVLVSKGPILNGLADYARKSFKSLLVSRKIEVVEEAVASVGPNNLSLRNGDQISFDACLWCTQASAPAWLADCGLKVDDKGFLLVNEYLQVDDGPSEIFAVGDAATSTKYPRPKAGVYAVRAGQPLYENIRRTIQGHSLKAHIPQSTHLNLISAGDHYAVAVKGWFGAQGRYLWYIKDHIDRTFMKKYGDDLNFDTAKMSKHVGMGVSSDRDEEEERLLDESTMRCAGCGSKIGANVLSNALQRLEDLKESSLNANDDSNPLSSRSGDILLQPSNIGSQNVPKVVHQSLLQVEDAVVLPPPPAGHATLHTIDFFKSLVSDPYIFGIIAAVHALSDCYAMGGVPTAALAIAVIPFATERIMEEDLFQVLAGAKFALDRVGCQLVGGHSTEGADFSVGFNIFGNISPEKILLKGNLKPNQALILTKPLGTGVILAAEMHGMCKGAWFSSAIQSMQQCNSTASKVFLESGATGCTDVTGFGLLGHLREMVKEARKSEETPNIYCEIDASYIPLLPGAQDCLKKGIRSSLHKSNKKLALDALRIDDVDILEADMWPLLVDPQTSGGLLGSVPQEAVEQCLTRLHAAGYKDAAVIGLVKAAEEKQLQEKPSDIPLITIKQLHQ